VVVESSVDVGSHVPEDLEAQVVVQHVVLGDSLIRVHLLVQLRADRVPEVVQPHLPDLARPRRRARGARARKLVLDRALELARTRTVSSGLSS